MQGDSDHNVKPPLTGLAYWSAALFLIFIWGSAFNLIEIAIRHVSVPWMVAFRLLIGAVFLGSLALLTKRRFPKLNDKRWLWYLVLGLTGMTIPFLFTATGQLDIDSTLGKGARFSCQFPLSQLCETEPLAQLDDAS